MEKIKISIQEIVNDYYHLAETEGFLSGLAEIGYCDEKHTTQYHNDMIELIDKYLPNWRNKIDNNYWESNKEDERGLILSTILDKNFREIFYQLV